MTHLPDFQFLVALGGLAWQIRLGIGIIFTASLFIPEIQNFFQKQQGDSKPAAPMTEQVSDSKQTGSANAPIPTSGRAVPPTASTHGTTGSPGGDKEAPSLESFTLSPSQVDATSGPAIVELRARITDQKSGVAGDGYTSSPSQVRFKSPSKTQIVDGMFDSGQHLINGTSQDGEYLYSMSVPQFSELGTWTIVDFLLVDQVGNQERLDRQELDRRGLQTSFEVIGQQQDMNPPNLLSFSLSPAVIEVAGGPAVINLHAHITDDLSGVAGEGFTSSPTQVRFESPSGQQRADGMFHSAHDLTDGTHLDGLYHFEVKIPHYAEEGTWELKQFLLVDQVGNQRTYNEREMRALGYPTRFEVRC